MYSLILTIIQLVIIGIAGFVLLNFLFTNVIR